MTSFELGEQGFILWNIMKQFLVRHLTFEQVVCFFFGRISTQTLVPPQAAERNQLRIGYVCGTGVDLVLATNCAGFPLT